MDCLFCSIATGKQGTLIYEDKTVVAFEDIEPQAPVHTLIIPKQHIASINDITEQDATLIGHMANIARQLAEDKGVSQRGYRLVFNCNPQGGQVIFHLHLHLLAGRQMTWPPG